MSCTHTKWTNPSCPRSGWSSCADSARWLKWLKNPIFCCYSVTHVNLGYIKESNLSGLLQSCERVHTKTHRNQGVRLAMRGTDPCSRSSPFTIISCSALEKEKKMKEKVKRFVKKTTRNHVSCSVKWRRVGSSSPRRLWVRACQGFLPRLAFPARNKGEWISGHSWRRRGTSPGMTQKEERRNGRKEEAARQLEECRLRAQTEQANQETWSPGKRADSCPLRDPPWPTWPPW